MSSSIAKVLLSDDFALLRRYAGVFADGEYARVNELKNSGWASCSSGQAKRRRTLLSYSCRTSDAIIARSLISASYVCVKTRSYTMKWARRRGMSASQHARNGEADCNVPVRRRTS